MGVLFMKCLSKVLGQGADFIMKKKIKCLVLGIFCFILAILIMPFIFRKSRIENLAKIELPHSAKIIDYRFGISPYGIDPFYSRVEIDRETFEILTSRLIYNHNSIQDAIDLVNRHFPYVSLNFENVKGLWVNELMRPIYRWGVVGSTGIVYVVITNENNGGYYIHVFY